MKLTAEISVADGFRRITGNALSHMIANTLLAERGNPEGIHQVRVSLRRLRAALLLFKRHLDPAESRAVRRALRALGRVLGQARDWDVFVLETLADAAREHPGAGWPRRAGTRGGRAAGASACRGSGGAERACLHAPGAVVRGLGRRWRPQSGAARRQGHAQEAQEDRAGDARPRRLGRRGRAGAASSIWGRSNCTRSASRSRSCATTPSSSKGLYEHDAVKRYRKHCERLQELLGRFNDARMTIVLTGRLAEHDGPSLAGAAETALVWAEARRDAALAELGPAWEEFEAAEPFWG